MRISLIITVIISVLMGGLTYHAVKSVPANIYDNAYFGADFERVSANLTDRWSEQSRTKVHPLSAMGLTIPVYVIGWALGVPRWCAMHLLVAVNAAMLAGLLFSILCRTTASLADAILFFLLAGSSAAFWIWLPTPEIFSFGSTTILLVVLMAAVPGIGAKPWSHYVAGIVSMAITITNWMAGLLYSFVFLGWKRSLSIGLHVFALVTILWGVQKYVFPSATFIIGDKDEIRFLNRQGVAKTTFRFFCAPYASVGPEYKYIEWMARPIVRQGDYDDSSPDPRCLLLCISYGAWFLLLAFGVLAMREADVDIRLRVLLAGIVGGQYFLHLIYSNETFIYTMHWLPILVIICSLTSRSRFRRVGLTLATLSAVLGLCINIPYRLKTMDIVNSISVAEKFASPGVVVPTQFNVIPRPEGGGK